MKQTAGERYSLAVCKKVAEMRKKDLHFQKVSVILHIAHGGIAQLGERLNGIQEVSGSIPLISTIEALKTIGFQGLFLFMRNFSRMLRYFSTMI